MSEYYNVLNEYSKNEYLFFSDIAKEEPANKQIAERYLKKYWLSQKEYESIWKPLQDSIFINQDKTLPHMMFTDLYKVIALRGGILLDSFDFRNLQKCMLALGNKYFVIIQQKSHSDTEQIPLLRLKYPVTISWQELMSGNYISAALFDISLFGFFIFSDSTTWGLYTDTDGYKPLILIGFKRKYAKLFKESFPVTEREERTIWEHWIPETYKKRLVSTVESPTKVISPEAEYQKIMDYYLDVRYSSASLRHISETEWNNKKGALEYLQQYWLPYEEYKTIWKPIQDFLFINQDKGIHDIIFSSQYEIIVLLNHYLFTKESLMQLQRCLNIIGDAHFVVIENNRGGLIRGPLFRLKYPVNVSWNILRSDNFISAVLCSKLNKYFVFGLSGTWGKYIDLSLNLLGFKPEYTQLFKDAFPVSAEEEEKAWKALPDVYKSEENRARLVSTVR